MLFVLSAAAFFLLITGLVLIHEAGHYFVAKKMGVQVEEFGFGLPPRAKTLFRYRGTDFTLNWIPFGGFVRLKGESDVGESQMSKGSLHRASIAARCAILLAGVAMNFLLAILIFLYGFSAGRWIPTYLTLEDMRGAAVQGEITLELGVLVDDVLAGGTAHEAGLQPGSVLVAVDGVQVEDPSQVVAAQENVDSVEYAYRLPDGEEETIRVAVQDGKTGVLLRTIPLHVAAPMHGPLTAMRLSLRETGVVTSQTILGIGRLFTSLASRGTVPEGVTGIVGIAQLTYASVQEGLAVYLRLVALLSLSLAILNILPFPALDGGRLLFVISEIFIRPGKRRVELITNAVGFGLLILLIFLITLYDVFRLFS